MVTRRFAAAYFGLQGLAIVAWWGVLLVTPGVRRWFAADAFGERPLLAFWLADLAVAVASLVVWLGAVRRGFDPAPWCWLSAGGMAYAALWCFATSLMTGQAWQCVALMTPAALLSIGSACVFQSR